MTLEAPTLETSCSVPCLKKGSPCRVCVNTRNYAVWVWRDKQCMPSDFHEYDLPIREREQNLLAEAGGWQEGAQPWPLGCERICAGAQWEVKAGEEFLRYGEVRLKGAVVGFRGETWSLGSLYRANREDETDLSGIRWSWMTRLFRKVEERDMSILFGD